MKKGSGANVPDFMVTNVIIFIELLQETLNLHGHHRNE
jgi:hypothetical protein